MKYIDFGFVILNYNTFSETIDCINSIKKSIINDIHYKIVVIDNCSPDESGRKLQNYFSNDDIVLVLKLDENMGFAKGNNQGINYLRQKYGCNFICCLNSDTLMIDKNFIKKIFKEYNKTNAAVIGPKIIMKDNKPLRFHHRLAKKEVYEKILLDLKKEYESTSNIKNKSVTKNAQQSIIDKLLNIIRYLLIYKKTFNVILQGSCLIFTPIFFTKKKGLCEETFLYREEDILLIELTKLNLKTEYFPKISIKHLEDASINTIVKNDLEKRKFNLKNQIDSLEIMLRKM